MKDIYVAAENTTTALGFDTQTLIENIKNGVSGLQLIDNISLSKEVLPLALVDFESLDSKINNSYLYTRFEKLLIHSIAHALNGSDIDISSPDTLLVITTTKGNIELLHTPQKEKFGNERILLHKAAHVVADYFHTVNKPLVISNACISGILGIVYAQRLLQQGVYKNVVVSGADVISKFVISGFQSFKSLSHTPCKPFDSERVGLSLGEGAGTMVLSTNKTSERNIRVVRGASANDANHISGPSRTAEGLFLAISRVLGNESVDYISAHGTATPYNDDMESVAINRAGLAAVPVNSFKAYLGHTLGAAGIIEAIIGIESMKRNELFKSLGSENIGVVEPINVIKENKTHSIEKFLKIGSGFGGCNAAVLFQKG
ncbi:MAG: beta-ketoacyl synthase [Bacteroidales bacterium]|nr:beta-ketoacyl synthase [Bacteroidales bacterium]